MFADQFRVALARAARADLHALSGQLWRAYAEGLLTENEAEGLSADIEARKAPPAAPVPRRTGSRPRAPESLERRRRWAAAGHLPPALAARFTLAEQAALAVVAVQVGRHGTCTVPLDAIAALAGVSRTVAKNALREARTLGLVSIQERRQSRWRNDTNVVRITSREWAAWIAHRGAGGGVKLATGTNKDLLERASSVPNPNTQNGFQARFSGLPRVIRRE